MGNRFVWQKDGFTLRLAEKGDAENYYAQNFCPLDKETARLTGCKETFTKERIRRDAVLDGDTFAEDIIMAILEKDRRKIKKQSS